MRRLNMERSLKLLATALTMMVVFNFALARETPIAPVNSPKRHREGTRLVEVTGRFEAVGDRVKLVIANQSESMHVLENLALQRVSRVLAESQNSQQWIISGTLTEYNGTNYLLLTKAVQAGKSATKEATATSRIGTEPKLGYPGPKDLNAVPKDTSFVPNETKLVPRDK
jgi:hypothetical protein